MNLRRLTNETIVYGIGRSIEGVAAFVVLPFIGRYLLPSVLGYADIILATVGLLYISIGLNFHQALVRYYHDVDNRTLISTQSIALLVNSSFHLLFGAAVVLLLRGFIMEPVAWVIAIAFIISQVLSEYITTVFRMRHEPLRYLAVVISTQVVLCVATPVLLVVFRAGILAIFIGKALAFGVGILVGLRWLLSTLKFDIDFAYLKRSIMFVLPLVPGNLASWALLYSPRYFLIAMTTAEQVGFYGVAVRFGYMLTMVGLAGSMAWAPFAMGIKDELNAPGILGRGLLYMTFVNVAVAAVISVFSYEGTFLLMGPNYIDAAPLIGPMMVATVFSNLMLIIFVQISISEKTIWQSIGFAIGVIVMGVLNLLLIPRFGAFGAVIATAVGHGAAASAHFIAGQRYFPVQTEIDKIVGMVVILAGVAFIGQWIEAHTAQRLVAVGWKVLLMGGAGVALLLTLGRREIQSSKIIVKRILTRQEHGDDSAI